LHFGISLPDVDFVPSTDGGYAICAGNSPREWTGLARAWHSEADFPLLLLGAPVRQSELPSNVVALPRVDFPAYVRLLAEARVVLLPLPDGWASWGQMTLLQAMALGKSVVVSNVRPVRDYVAEGCLTVPGADHRAMARAAVRLRHDHAGRVRLGEQARSAVEHSFNEVTMARRFESIIAAILG
jgi:glycosyltransferase involved in cell wall biosynthesis